MVRIVLCVGLLFTIIMELHASYAGLPCEPSNEREQITLLGAVTYLPGVDEAPHESAGLLPIIALIIVAALLASAKLKSYCDHKEPADHYRVE